MKLPLDEPGLRLVITGGGTGGHVSPGLAVAGVWQKKFGRDSVLWVGKAGGMETGMCAKAGVAFAGVEARPLKRSLDPQNFLIPLSLFKGFGQSWKLLKEWKPDAVLMTGGYAGAAMALAAALNNTPLVLLELDAVPGLANRIFSGAAEAICLAQPIRDKRRHAVYTGSPVRFSPRLPSRTASLKQFGLKGSKPVVLVLPGSGAAHSINMALMQGLKRLGSLQLLWMTGAKDEAEVLRAVKKADSGSSVHAFIDDVPAAYAAADLVLARCGASMLAEIALTGKPSLLVPYPHATRDHQRLNAVAFVEQGAARMMLDHELGGERLAEEIQALCRDKAAMKQMAAAAKKIGRPDAAANVAGVLMRVAKGFKYV